MPPRAASRHLFCTGRYDPNGNLYLTERTPFAYRDLPDNIRCTVREGDTLWTVAARHFAGLRRAAMLWWVIADFQSPPIVDPTLALVVGSTLVLPSVRTLRELICNPSRQTDGADGW